MALRTASMKEHGLEDVMMDFYDGNYDVLLCTTIIEQRLGRSQRQYIDCF